MQEASGSLTDSIGSLALPATGTVSYQQAVAGWTRKAVTTADNVAGSWGVGAGSGPNPGAQSVAYLAYVGYTTPAAERGLMYLSGAASHLLETNITSVGLLRQYVNTGAFNSVNSHGGGTVHPLLVVFDRTGSRAMMYTDLEKRASTYSASVTDGPKAFGSSAPPAAQFLYGAWWAGASAEFTDAQAKALLQTLGWTIPWT